MSNEQTATDGNAKIRDQYEGFLASDDIGYNESGGKTVSPVIREYKPAGTVIDSKKQVVELPVLYFEKSPKGFVLNKTNERILKLVLGKDISKWPGNKITLGVGFVAAFGERDVPVIRVQPPKGIPLPFGVRKWLGKPKPSGGAR